MINGVSHCGYCGRPMRDCAGCDAQPTKRPMIEVFDHYPFDDGMDAGRLNTIHDALSLVSVPTPVTPPPLPPRVKFGDYWICQGCKLASEFCGCAKQRAPDVQSKDGGESSLERRARQCMGGK